MYGEYCIIIVNEYYDDPDKDYENIAGLSKKDFTVLRSIYRGRFKGHGGVIGFVKYLKGLHEFTQDEIDEIADRIDPIDD